MEAYLERTAPERDLMVFAPYLFGTTLWGAQVAPERSALMPCLHDEPYARLRTVARVMEGTRGCLFNAPGEERLARGMFRIPAGGVVGMGFDPPGDPPAARSPLDGDYVVYAGRLEEGKRVHVAVEWAVRHRREDPRAPRLLLLGHGSYRPPADSGDAVVVAGFVDEQTKRAAYAGAVAVVNPSHMESLSLVLLEGWREGAPAVVAAGSEVMRDHCERSGGGFAVEGYEAYRHAVSALRDDPDLRRRMGAAGGEYVQDVYGWPAVRARFRETVEALAA
jgi:glycosyltransferase involved in cell wall biosynthesis